MAVEVEEAFQVFLGELGQEVLLPLERVRRLLLALVVGLQGGVQEAL